ncbi:ribosomal eL19 family protein [Erwinia psidii]|uniref:Type III secretion system protein n=1 Tax=Erwinia psidii TaxID=69224 RepID=A0A3N6SJJ7_9GAMM|nr:type III secretion system protein [Erwinia psidii]MCX8958714.1 type III secretion system protein [Erwinia psidii]MCX8961156.1 type III secretion system protein [Erwinia psidii]MCX8966672.1 type III secretion system protein [Erwinia psidii]RQM38951.1 type III secretion system protein [Erwinia psidii]
MNVWREGRTFVSMLERKQHLLSGDIVKVRNTIAQIKQHIALQYKEHEEINQKIKNLTPSGVTSRSEIYQRIRRQGTLLSQQQNIIQKINQLESERSDNEQMLQHHLEAMILLDKRHHKMSGYLQEIRKMHLRRRANNRENEVQEMAGHVSKNH